MYLTIIALTTISIFIFIFIFYALPTILIYSIRAKIQKIYRLNEKNLVIGDVAWSYLSGGEGTPIVFVPGFGSTKFQWGDSTYKLASQHQIICIDLPGFGNSKIRSDEFLDPESQAKRLIAFIKHLNLQNVTLVGSSIGGYICCLAIRMWPDLADRIVLIDPAGFRPSILSEETERFLRDGNHPFSYTTTKELDALYDLLFYKPPSIPFFMKQYIARQNRKQSHIRDVALRALRLYGLFNINSEINSFDQDILVIWGSNDRLFHPTGLNHFSSEKFETLLVADCGHLPYLENPNQTVNAISEFIRTKSQGNNEINCDKKVA